MALILAINPGNTHSPTLARLARELQGCEIIGAESCAVAIRAIDERVPDIILLPAMTPRGEPDLMSRLLRVPGGIPTLRLPPPMSADPKAVAAEIRDLLAGPAEPAIEIEEEPEPEYLVGAAHVAIGWIRARRAAWGDGEAYTRRRAGEPEPEPEPEPVMHPVMQVEAREAVADEPEPEPREPAEAPSPDLFAEPQGSRSWLPWAAGALVLAGLAGGSLWYWTVCCPAEPARNAAEPAAPPAMAALPPPEITADLKFPGSDTTPAPAEPRAPGTIAVTAPFDVTVTEANTPVPLDGQRRATLASGRHRLRFRNVEAGYDETRTVDVPANGTAAVALNPQTTVRITANQPAEVLMDGVRLGETPFEGTIPLGSRTIAVRSPAGERQYVVQATSKPVEIDVDFTRP